ncbi:hypothetical protein THAPSDRAFT_269896 [Thalassiosira pseudonana CCMP1335]|uniref:MIOS-like alpha-solenoid domain-containing protein n=1 Tax=Thalassiosira pseudonana TaxID=35128 RepID=B8CDZ4_THAPS|nr:hypothetical protein THAPSDRAFT_269896 [Thalassiosira pseudonana CCMP1335]EED88181.1 hypothetical protein THAPSDRAFT_269896 [Thalassiosira pseudonana CCMP1335]
MKLLRMSSRDVADENNNWMDNKSTSDTLSCDEYDTALNACGWIKKYGVLRDLLDECEARGEFERSAALAIWHGNIGECVAALQRGAEDMRELTLSLIAMCVAGFNMTMGSDGVPKTSTVWSNASICTFLLNLGKENGLNKTIHDEGLSLADRVAFSCRFLSRADLRSFLDTSLRKCLKTGNIEGLLITGLDKRGIGLIQSFVDRCSDVQTAALISSRLVLPEGGTERRMCSEWLDSYRMLLNNLQMWHSRAAFDVGSNSNWEMNCNFHHNSGQGATTATHRCLFPNYDVKKGSRIRGFHGRNQCLHVVRSARNLCLGAPFVCCHLDEG